MKVFAVMAVSAGLFAGPMLANEGAAESTKRTQAKSERVSTPQRGLEEAQTLNQQSLSQAIAFEREKVRRAQREAKLNRTVRGTGGEVAADYVGPSARSGSSADRVMDEDDRVPAPSPQENRDWRQDPPQR